jgi:hypothetical protein
MHDGHVGVYIALFVGEAILGGKTLLGIDRLKFSKAPGFGAVWPEHVVVPASAFAEIERLGDGAPGLGRLPLFQQFAFGPGFPHLGKGSIEPALEGGRLVGRVFVYDKLFHKCICERVIAFIIHPRTKSRLARLFMHSRKDR